MLQGAIFQHLLGFADDLKDGDFEVNTTYRGEVGDARVYSYDLQQFPSVVRGGGNNKLLNQIGNYVPLMWTKEKGCVHCNETRLCLPHAAEGMFPKVSVNVLVESVAPFLRAVLDGIAAQDYPKSRMAVVFTFLPGPSESKYRSIVNKWAASVEFGSVSTVGDGVDSSKAFLVHEELLHATISNHPSDYVFHVDSSVVLKNNRTLRSLIETNKEFVAPAVNREGLLFANYWGATTGDFDAQCFDYDKRCPRWKIEKECESSSKNKKWMDVS